MITAVKGTVFGITPGEVSVMTASGIVYKVLCPVSSYSEIRGKESLTLHTVLKHKDEELILYGFLTVKERFFFEKMISISGVGGKTALSFISAFTVREFAELVEAADVTKLSSVPGIGKKTAQRLVLELTGKLDYDGDDEQEEGTNLREELISGLVNLGYPESKVKPAVKKIMSDEPADSGFEDLFKKIIKKVSRL